jgi:hypothetical protein
MAKVCLSGFFGYKLLYLPSLHFADYEGIVGFYFASLKLHSGSSTDYSPLGNGRKSQP